ncbi:MAG: response regulator transcription factor [Chitinophagaceae bacterium]|nr:response regulator transcription factor [Chitinophagaceae bacterium]
MKKVLIIEDDKHICELVDIHLRDIHCQATKVHTGAEGLFHALNRSFDLIILDIMLPDMDGIEICRRLRADSQTTAIMILTSRSEEMDKIIGLEIGADDYLTKPFSIRELIARIKAIFRRIDIHEHTFKTSNEIIHHQEISLDPQKRKAVVRGIKIELTPKEFDLLYLLASTPGRSFTREALLHLVWGNEFSGYEHTVNSHINRLRGKIEPDLSRPKYILTTWGVGYRFNDEL